MESQGDAYRVGASAAIDAIAKGVPRWVDTCTCPLGQAIDPRTGLPIAQLSGPPELIDWNVNFARGYNDVIATAIKSGEVTIDFRPLVMTRPEVWQALADDPLGELSIENPRLFGPKDEFCLSLRLPKAGAKKKLTWIDYRHCSGGHWPNYDVFENPLEVGVGRGGRVLVFRSQCLLVTRDVATTQVLISFPV